VRSDVAQGAGAGHLLAEPPDQRELRIDDPVLQVHRADVADRAEATCLDQLSHQRHGRHAAVVEAAHRPYAPGLRLRGGRGHLAGLGHRVGQRFLAEHVLAGGERGQRDLLVRVARGADVDEVDVLPGDHAPPVGGVLRPAEFRGRGGDTGVAATADQRHLRRQRQIERVVDGAPRL
jgi:hypothetical protein